VADIFVLPSRPALKVAEQFGYVLVESMASQKPVLTTSVGSIPTVVSDAAIVIPPNDSAALAREIIRLIHSPAERKRLGEAGRRWVESAYDARANAGKLEDVYRHVTAIS
jgi:glycosyltransferase involved in cell wall biosynthesis